jgi:ankyrin repeat domain-containing protein 50
MQKELKEFCMNAQLNASLLTVNGCKSFIKKFIGLYPQTTIILDALDECERDTQDDLIRILQEFLEEALRPLKLLISSRPEGNIRAAFKDTLNVNVTAADNGDDIFKFVSTEIAKHRKWEKWKKEDPGLETEIVGALQRGAKGM